MAAQLAHGRDIGDDLGVDVESKILGHLPDEDLSIVRGRGDDAVVEGVPICVEHRGSVASEKGYLVGQLSALVEGNDGEGTAASRLPVDREVFGVHLSSSGEARLASCRAHRGVGGASAGVYKEVGTLTRLVSQALRLIWRLS
jgi:hypothetical protein